MFTFTMVTLVVAWLYPFYLMKWAKSMEPMPGFKPSRFKWTTVALLLWACAATAVNIKLMRPFESDGFGRFLIGCATLSGPLIGMIVQVADRALDASVLCVDEITGTIIGWEIANGVIVFVEGAIPHLFVRVFGFVHFYGGVRIYHLKRLQGQDGRQLKITLAFKATVAVEPKDFEQVVQTHYERFVEKAQTLLDRSAAEQDIRELACYGAPGLRIEVQKLRLFPAPINLLAQAKGVAA